MYHSKQGLANIKKGCINRIGMIIVNNGKQNKWVQPNNIPNGYSIGSTYQTNNGKIIVNNGITQKMVYPDQIPKGYSIGSLPFTEEHIMVLINGHRNMSLEKKLERNRKIGQKNKGRPSWSKGKHLSLEHRIAISKGNKNKKITDEQKQAIANRQRGKIKVNNGVKTIYADPNNIPEGYVKGQLHLNQNNKQ